MMEQWRRDFGVPGAFFGIVQLSTWCPKGTAPDALAQIRVSQVASLTRPGDAYATNADHGAGCNIHPPFKQYPGARLARAALSIVYGVPGAAGWRSPTYASAAPGAALGTVAVALRDAPPAGLALLRTPFNAGTAGNCTALNAATPGTCAWAGVQFNDPAFTWVNASVALSADGAGVVLTASSVPAGATGVTATSYGWGPIPMLTVYSAAANLPVLPWREAL